MKYATITLCEPEVLYLGALVSTANISDHGLRLAQWLFGDDIPEAELRTSLEALGEKLREARRTLDQEGV